MFTHLYIKDFILIDELSIDLREGFTAITGETGAGKSILIGAINLILGARADSKTVREGARKAIIEMECDLSRDNQLALKALFESEDIDYEPHCILRRELTPQGKSRAFINDMPVSMATMRLIGEHLIDVHSQHHNMLIGDSSFQMSVVDNLAQTEPQLAEYKKAYKEYRDAHKKLQQAREELAQQERDRDYISFQYNQLEEAHIKPNELQNIEERLRIAHNMQNITDSLQTLAHFSNEKEDGTPSLMDEIMTAIRGLEKAADDYTPAAELKERLDSVRIELFDISSTADDLLSDLELDNDELVALESRVDLLQDLLFKHHLKDSDELIALRDEYKEKLDHIENSDHYLAELEKEVNKSLENAKKQAAIISSKRKEASEAITPDLHRLMKVLGITGATFKIALTPSEQLTATGADQVEFLFATNKSKHLRPIREIASGGEISRFMLALKTILASKSVLPTIIFDEIDTGVSGEVAEKLGNVMRELSDNVQVISITHLPQIAAQADHQLVVEKKESEESYLSNIREVKGSERVRQIASMLSGAQLTQEAINNAEALLQSNKKQKK